jgi:sugar phosphate isomerase/epimerase
MTSVLGIGLTAKAGAPDGSTIGAILDGFETFDITHVELSTYENDLIIGGRIHQGNLARIKSATAGRTLGYSVHGPLGINFFDEAYRLPRHFDVLKAAVEIAGELGAVHYVLHSGLMKTTQSPGIEAAYERQREWFHKAAELGAAHNIIICVENLFSAPDGTVHASTASRLALELGDVNHAHLRATLDVSHAFQHCTFWGFDFLAEIAALAPFAKHVHMHDSFGLPDDIWMYTQGERIAFGHGDLHMPVGWGSIPWADVSRVCHFPNETLFNIELNERFFYAAEECIAKTRDVAARAGAIPSRGSIMRQAAE